MGITKPNGDHAEEILQGTWPNVDEDRFAAAAGGFLVSSIADTAPGDL